MCERPNRRSPTTPDVNRAGNSVVKLLGTACGLGIEGSGWVAGPGLVVTNAHVVAGEDDTTVTLRSGGTLDASAVHYDPHNDLAILRVDGLGLRALTLPPAGGQGHRWRGAGLSGERAVHGRPGASGKHRPGDQRGLIRTRPCAAKDDSVSGSGAERQLRRTRGRFRRPGPDHGVRRGDGARAGRGAGGAQRDRGQGSHGSLRPTGTGPCAA